jgi:hypothetical protein
LRFFKVAGMSLRTNSAAALAVLALFAAPAAAAAKDEKGPAPAPIARVVACQSVADSAQRLACFDREVAAMAQAEASGELVAMDRQQLRRTKRSLFGIALPDLDVFGDNDGAEGDTTLETTIKSARQRADGKWILDLAEGGRWMQIDSHQLAQDPRPGHPIRIRQAAMGSYLANVNKQYAIRVRRVQ